MAGESSGSRLSKYSKGEGSVEVLEDRFKQLPSSLLVSILSFLPIEHSARTSILSKYWKGLWLFSPRLDFDASELLKKLEASNLPRSEWGSKYVEWVNKVLCAHKALHSDNGYVLEKFRICFELDLMYSRDINSWLSYAFSKKVQELELNLSRLSKHDSRSCLRMYLLRYGDYSFPNLIDPSNDEYSDKTEVHDYEYCKPLVLTGFRILKSLALEAVNVSGEAIDFLLRKFPLLEHLKVSKSYKLVSVKVCGLSLALKYLEITKCMNLGSIIVQDSHLVSLKIDTVPELVLENVPMLVDVWVSAQWVGEILPQLYISLSKVKVLTLSVKSNYIEEVGDKVNLVPQLPAVKQLVLIVGKTEICDSLIPLTSLLLRSMPNLEKFVLKLKHVADYPFTYPENYDEPLNLPLEHLMAVEFRGGYHHLGLEYKFATLLLRNAKALVKIILKPSDEEVQRFRILFPDTPKMTPAVVGTIRDMAKARAERLRGLLPSSVKLVVL